MPFDEWLKVGLPVLTGLLALLGSWLGAKLGKTTEHQQWLRNHKQEAYVTFLSTARRRLDAGSIDKIDSAPPKLEWMTDELSQIQMVGSDAVREIAPRVVMSLLALHSASWSLRTGLGLNLSQQVKDGLDKRYTETAESVRDLMSEFEEIARRDVGSE